MFAKQLELRSSDNPSEGLHQDSIVLLSLPSYCHVSLGHVIRKASLRSLSWLWKPILWQIPAAIIEKWDKKDVKMEIVAKKKIAKI